MLLFIPDKMTIGNSRRVFNLIYKIRCGEVRLNSYFRYKKCPEIHGAGKTG